MEHSKRVLIIDLDQELLVALGRVLEAHGLDTTTTRDVRAARALMQTGCFDFLVVGNRPPELDAQALVMELRGQGLRFGCAVLGGDDQDLCGNLIERIRRASCCPQAARPRLSGGGDVRIT